MPVDLASLEDQYGLPPGLLNAVMQVESNGNPDAVGPQTRSGERAQGAFQFMPATAKQYGVDDPFDLQQSASGAAQYLGALMKKNNGDLPSTLASYNWGPANVANKGLDAAPPETVNYIKKVSAKMAPDPSKVQWDDASAPDASAGPDPSQVQWDNPAPQSAPQGQPPAKQSTFDAVTRGVGSYLLPGGQYLPDLAMGARQPIDALADMASRGASALADKFSPGGTIANWLHGQQASTTQANQAAKDDYEKTFQPDLTPGADIARGVPAGIATNAILPGSGAIGALKAAQLGAGQGAVGAALTPIYGAGDNSDYVSKLLKQTGTGAAVGGVAAGALGGLGQMFAPNVGAAQRTLMDSGITLTLGQRLGGIAQWLENGATSIPVVGNFIRGAQSRSINDFNTALYNKALAPIANDPVLAQVAPDVAKAAQGIGSVPVGNQGIKATGDALSDAYNAILPHTPVTADAPFVQNVIQLRNMAQSLPPDQAQQFNSILQNNVLNRFAPGDNSMLGNTMKEVDSTLGGLARKYQSGVNNADQQRLGDAIQQLQANLRDMVARQNPTYAPTIQNINQGWSTLAQIEKAGGGKGAMSNGGVITPSQFQGAVKAGDNTVRDRATARGTALNQDFAAAAQNVLPNKFPDSGTGGRAMEAGGIGALLINPAAALAAAPGILTGGAAMIAPYTRMGGRAAQSVLTARPQALQQTGGLLKYLAPALGGLLGTS